MDNTLYRRPLPADTIAFSSSEGRRIFAEALADGGLDGYFPLAEQFHTQSDPAFCGLGSLVVALNALAIDPGRLWKGPWRWFAEDLLDCCVPLDHVRAYGLALDELACLARCNGVEVDVQRGAAEPTSLSAFRNALLESARAERVLIAAYDRSVLGQTGSGHYSPIGGYHSGRDLALVLDVARFKYPPHWVSAERLWQATQSIDPATGLARGWMLLRPRAHGLALGFSLRCQGTSWTELAERVAALSAAAEQTSDPDALVRAFVPLAKYIELREPTAPAHLQALASARAELRESLLHSRIATAVGGDATEAVTLLMLVMCERLEPWQRAQLGLSELPATGPLADELSNLRAQLTAVTAVARI